MQLTTLHKPYIISHMNAPDSFSPTPNSQSGVRSQDVPTSTPQRGITLNHLTDPRARVIAAHHRRIPRTQHGHLGAVIRADLVPSFDADDPIAVTASQTAVIPDEAYIPLNYDEGFPAFPDGRPLWFRMEHEPQDMFLAFQAYVDLIAEGPRHIASLLESGELQAAIPESLNMETLRNAYYMYFWKDRAFAHDIFQDAAYRHIRLRRALSTEDKSYQLATKMLTKLEGIFEKPEFWQMIEHDASTALQYLEKLTRIQRIAAGLPAAAPAGEDSGGSSSFEMIMRKVQDASTHVSAPNEGNTPGGAMLDESGRLVPTESQFMRGALGNPNTAKMMQEVIIRMTRSAGATKQPRWAGKVGPDENEMEEDPDSGEGAEGVVSSERPSDEQLNEIPSEFRHLAGG